MKILVGVTPDASASDAMALGAVLQELTGGEVVLASVYAAASDQSGKRKVDAEWVEYLRADAQEIVDEAAAEAPRRGLKDFTTTIHGHRSSGVGLPDLIWQKSQRREQVSPPMRKDASRSCQHS